VLLVRGDGRYVGWLSVPRWLPPALVATVGVAVLVNGALVVDYVHVRRQHAAIAASRDRLEERARALAPMEQRLGELRDEMVAWDGLHESIWKPLGAERHAAAVGIGGPVVPASVGKRLDEIDVLLAHVREESRRLRALARVTRETGTLLAALPSRLPLRSALNSPFGPRLSPWTGQPEFHAGVDLAAASGTPVNATAAGVVRFAGTSGGYGNTVLVDHGAGIESRYGNLQRIGVTPGQRVERGQTIGLSGNTGRSTAPHLHYEVLVNGRPVDPRRLARN
jgi:murein DD-endopeptidase MepM/ murein hydrolase activator NlpD